MTIFILHRSSMADLVPGFIKVTEAGQEYKTSRSTLDRRREAARVVGSAKFYRVFRLRTKDGEVFEQPSKEQVARLTKEGRVPEWFVSRSWLAKEFGKRDGTNEEPPLQGPAQEPDRSIASDAAVRQLLEERIKDLKEQLQAERQEKKELLQYAQADKQMFAQAAHQLTQVLALPAIAEANKNRTAIQNPETPTRSEPSANADRGKPSDVSPVTNAPDDRSRWSIFRLLRRR